MYGNDAINNTFDFDFEFGRRAACSIKEKPLFALLSRLPMRTTKEIVAQRGPEEQEVIIDAFAGAERHLGQALLFFAEQGRIYVERHDYAEIADFVAWNEQARRNWSL